MREELGRCVGEVREAEHRWHHGNMWGVQER